MGQQQVLGLVIGLLIVTVAIAAGMMAFTDTAAIANRDAMIGDMQRLAAKAQGYYRRPAFLGGGGLSFSGLKLGVRNPNGTYTLASVEPDRVVLVGQGWEKGPERRRLTMTMTVYADTMMLAPGS
jgi:hypothetical protein